MKLRIFHYQPLLSKQVCRYIFFTMLFVVGLWHGVIHAQQWKTYTTKDGLAANWVTSIVQAQDGALWFGTMDGGVSRYDGTWQTYTEVSAVNFIFQDREGALWFGTVGSQVSRYDGKTWHTYSMADLGYYDVGLPGNGVTSVVQARDGTLWFGATESGVGRYDGTTWRTYTEADGLAHNWVQSVFEDREGVMWFGTAGGVSRYDGTTWQTYTTADGLAANWVESVFQAQDGAMWFGTRGGVSRYDGTTWHTYTTADGLVANDVVSVFQDREGAMWFGTRDGGVSRFRQPSHSLVQTQIFSSLPPILGVNRFYIECRGYEIGWDGLPPLSYALTRGTDRPRDSDWSPFMVAAGVELREYQLTNGQWTFHVRAQDRYGNIDPTPATSTFTVDLIPPTVAITNPRSGDVVGEDVPLVGAAFDGSATPDLDYFVLEYGYGTDANKVAEWRPIGERQSSPIESGVLGIWKTEGLPDGDYVLRLWARDRLGHTSEHKVTVTLVSALQQIEKDVGGRVASAKGTVNLMVPPNGLTSDAQVQIVFRAEEGVPPPPPGVRATGIAYEVGPATIKFNQKKRSTLTIGYQPEDLAGLPEAELAIFMLSENVWTRLGGTVNATKHTVSVAIRSPGTYALFIAPSTGGAPDVSDVACQPRIISPADGLYPTTTDISFRLGARATVDVTIYSVSGNLIREVTKDWPMNEGLNTVQWDGRDREGKVVTSGLYMVVVKVAEKAATHTVAVLNK